MEFRVTICSLLRACIALGVFLNACESRCPSFFSRGNEILCITGTNRNVFYYEQLYSKVSSRCSEPMRDGHISFTNVDCKLEDVLTIHTYGFDYVREFSSGSDNPNSILSDGFLNLFVNVEQINLSAANIETIEPGAFGRTRSLNTLDLSRNRIKTIEPGTFNNTKRVTDFDLSSNRIEALPPDIFDNMRNLTHLDLSSNFMANLPIGIFKNLFQLEKLVLSNCSLESLDPHLFLNLTRLKKLYLEDNKVKRLESNTFSGNNRLSVLNISCNEIRYLSTGAFPKNSSMWRLYMHHNKLREIARETFEDLHQLGELDLSWNEITALKDKPFRKLKNLQKLELSGNKLSRIACSEFSGLTVLRGLYISSNNIESVDSCAFKDMQQYFSLDLGSNMLNALDTSGGIFGNVSGLILSNNKLVDLSNVFLKSSIRDLFLDRNFNLVLSNNTFAGIRELYFLSMESCNIASLPEGIFRSISKIRYLLLKDNFIREIDLSERPLRNSISIDLSYNKIESLNLSSLRKLQFFNISHNSISQLQGSENLKYLLEFDASFNNLTDLTLCTRKKNTICYLSHNSISSLNNLFCKGSDIRTLDVSHNNLSGITYDQWESILCIEKFEAGNNHIRELIIPETLECNSRLYHEIHLENNELTSIQLPKNKTRTPTKSGELGYIGHTFDFYLSDNPIHCGCSAYEVYKYLKDFDITRHYVNIRDEVTCHRPMRLKGKILRELVPTDFWCDYQEECVNGSLCAPAFDCVSRCRCYYRAHDNVRITECTNSSFEELPTNVPLYTELLYIDHNSLKSLAALSRPLWQNLTEIHAEYNEVESEHIPIPPNVILLSLKGNKLRKFPPSIQFHAENKSDFKVTLSENFWPCECSVLPLKTFLLEHPSKVFDLDNVTCSFSDGSSLVLNKASDLDLCPYITLDNMIPLFLSIAAAVFFLIIGVCIYLYYNYKIYILALLYVRCNWCYRLLCCDRRIKETKIFDGFIAYSSNDYEAVVEILRELEPEYQFCVHQRNWLAGSPIINNIFHSVQNSRKYLMILSAEFLRSQWFPLEFDAAFQQAVEDRRDRMIVIVKGDLPPHSELPEEVRYFITTRTYLRWGDPWFFDRLRFAMQEEQPFLRRQMHQGSGKSCSCCSCLSSPRNQAREVIIELAG